LKKIMRTYLFANFNRQLSQRDFTYTRGLIQDREIMGTCLFNRFSMC